MGAVQDEVKVIEQRAGVLLTGHHIVLYIVLALALGVGWYFFQSHRVAVAEGKQAVAEAVAKQAKEDAIESEKKNAEFQAQIKLQVAQLEADKAQLVVTNQQLTEAMRAQAAALANQQKADRVMPPTQQAARWQQLVPATVVTVTPTGFSLDLNSGLNTLLEIEKVPVLTAQLDKAVAQIQNDQKIFADDVAILERERAAHKSDLENDAKKLVASQEETKKIKSEFDTYKQKSRRNMMRVAVISYGLGWLTRQFMRIP